MSNQLLDKIREKRLRAQDEPEPQPDAEPTPDMTEEPEAGRAELDEIQRRLDAVEQSGTERDQLMEAISERIAELQEQAEDVTADDLKDLASQIEEAQADLSERIADVRQFAGITGLSAVTAMEMARRTASGAELSAQALQATEAIQERVKEIAKVALLEDDEDRFHEELQALPEDEQDLVNDVLPAAVDQAKEEIKSEQTDDSEDADETEQDEANEADEGEEAETDDGR